MVRSGAVVLVGGIVVIGTDEVGCWVVADEWWLTAPLPQLPRTAAKTNATRSLLTKPSSVFS